MENSRKNNKISSQKSSKLIKLKVTGQDIRKKEDIDCTIISIDNLRTETQKIKDFKYKCQYIHTHISG